MNTKNKTPSRRAFLGTAGSLFSAWALSRIVPACSPAKESPGLLRDPAESPGSKAPPTPTDDDEFVPGAGASQTSTLPPAEANPGNPEWTQKAKALLDANQGGIAYTMTSPGPFKGKERSHVPQMTIQSDGVAIILVNHVMDPGFAGNEAGAPDGGDAGLAAGDAARDAGDSGLDAGSFDSGARPLHYVSTIWATDVTGRVVFMKELAATDPAPPFIAFKIPEGTAMLTAYEHCNLHGVWAGDAMPAG
jgi:hypothetical protein